MSDNESPVGSPAKDPVNEDQDMDAAVVGSDHESDILSEIDEDELDDYDPAMVNIEDRPIDIDEDNARTLKASKRKRTDAKPRKPREGRRDKKRRDDDVAMADGSDREAPSKPARRRAAAAADGDRAPKDKASSPEPENEENLTPDERRKRAIDRALDAAMKKPGGAGKRRRKDEIVCRFPPFV